MAKDIDEQCNENEYIGYIQVRKIKLLLMV